MTLIQEKVNQAIEILKEQQTDLWLTFVRETSGVRDPALDFLIGANDLTWPSALILTRKGEKIAIIGNLEKDALQRLNVFDEILGYDSAVSGLLRDTITRSPGPNAVNTSRKQRTRTVLTPAGTSSCANILLAHLTRIDLWRGTNHHALRGRNTPAELARIRKVSRSRMKLQKTLTS